MDKMETAWCPGCGNHAIRNALEAVLQELPLPQESIVMTSGIGQAAKMPQYLDVNYFNGLHGRSLPVAVGIKLARPDLTVIAYSGDGCMYGEGGNHFIHAARINVNITVLVSDNKVYGLTKGQTSPTTDLAVTNALDPWGNTHRPLNPLALAITVGAPFVARGFAGDPDYLRELLREAILFPGFAVVDILQPCVTFNRVNTFGFYRERVKKVQQPPTDRLKAIHLAQIWGDTIPIGVLYKDTSIQPYAAAHPLWGQTVSAAAMEGLIAVRHGGGPG